MKLPLTITGFRRTLTMEDLRPLPVEYTTEVIAAGFQAVWNRLKLKKSKSRSVKDEFNSNNNINKNINSLNDSNNNTKSLNNRNIKNSNLNKNEPNNNNETENNSNNKNKSNSYSSNKNVTNAVSDQPSILTTVFCANWRSLIILFLIRLGFVALDLLKPVVLGSLLQHVTERSELNGDEGQLEGK